MSFSTSCFDPTGLHFKLGEQFKWVSIEAEKDKQLYSLLTAYILGHLVDEDISSPSYGVSVISAKKSSKASHKCCEDSHNSTEQSFGRVAASIGYGQFTFSDFEGNRLYGLHQKIGKPLATNCGAQMYTTLVVFTEGSMTELYRFLSKLIEDSEKSLSGYFTCYAWHIRYQYWRQESRILARPMNSVVLPESVKDRLISDIEKFLLPATQSFYNRNGIPYRRSYLFHGLPGTGKTSMVQALAGHFGRNVCYLMPTHPEMTDDSLRSAMTELPEDSIVVFEDIDSLFAKDRSNKVSKSCLTFSGLLNALDGIGNPKGQIFILTTNLREQLDHALIRNGRVDMHVEFTFAVDEQMEKMWTNFYPEAEDALLAKQFSARLRNLLKANDMQMTAACLQHYFTSMMDCTAKEALEKIENIVSEIKENNTKEALEALKAKERNENGGEGNSEEEGEDVEEEKGVGKKGGRRKNRCSKAKGSLSSLALSATVVTVFFAIAWIHTKR